MIRIGLTSHRSVSPYTVAALFGLSGSGEFTLDIEMGAVVEVARNRIAARLREPYLLFVDSDMAFGPKHVSMLLEALEGDPGLGAVGALYKKWKNGNACLGWREGGGWMPEDKATERAEAMRGVHTVDTCGAGLLLIRKEVLDALPAKPFKGRYLDNGTYEGEDTGFWALAQEAGFRPSVHFDCRVGHVGPTMWGFEDLGEADAV